MGDSRGNQLRVGAATLTRVVDWVGPIALVADLFPETPADLWRENAWWLAPDFYEPVSQSYRPAIQTWVVQGEGQPTVLIDTGVGDDRERPQVPRLTGLHTGFLERLAAAGIEPGDVDIVVNTHIHYDHVGWNTRLVDGAWRPTFPNARYFVPQADHDYFRPDRAERRKEPRDEDERRRLEGSRLTFADSITPVEQAGQLVTWSGTHQLTDTLRLAPAPGHTPGSSVVWLEDGDGAVFAGDLVHTPLQLARPDDACSFDLDPTRAVLSRRRVLSEAARTGSLLVPAHLAGPGAATIQADGSGYSPTWCALEHL